MRIEVFRYSAWLRAWGAVATCLMLAVGTVALLQPRFDLQPLQTYKRIGGALLCAVFAAFFIRRVVQFMNRVEIGPDEIAILGPRGRRRSLRWKDVRWIRDRREWGRMELHGDGGLKLRLEEQLSGYSRLRAIVLARTDWPQLLADPGSTPTTRPTEDWPRQFGFTGRSIAGACAFAACVPGVAALLASLYFDAGFWLGGVIGLACGTLGCLLAAANTRSVLVDRDAVTIRSIVRTRRIDVADMEEASCPSSQSVILRLKGGRTVGLMAHERDALRLYHAVCVAAGLPLRPQDPGGVGPEGP